MITVIANNKLFPASCACVEGDNLWIDETQARAITGDAHDPLDSSEIQDGRINLSAYSQARQRPLLSDESMHSWVLGSSAKTRSSALHSLRAPDFTLQDLNGVARSLSDYKGQKVFLVSWSSW